MKLEINNNSASVTVTTFDLDKNATQENYKEYFPQEFKDLMLKYKDTESYKETIIYGRSAPYPENKAGISKSYDGFIFYIEW